jgi:putative ABC transport system permease protein
MIVREFLSVAVGNLWRMKLRSALTIAGIVVATGALVALLAFAFGVQRNVSTQFRALGLFRTLHVMPPLSANLESLARGGDPDDEFADAEGQREARYPNAAAPGAIAAGAADSSGAPQATLDDAALRRIAAIDGVTLVYPQETFDAQLEWPGHKHTVTAQALPAQYAERCNPGSLLAGRFYAADNATEVVLNERMLTAIGVSPDSIVGARVKLRTAGVTQLAYGVLAELLQQLSVPPELLRLIREATQAFQMLLGRGEVELTVCGVARLESGFGFRVHDVLVPSATARRLDRLSFSDPFDLLAQLSAFGRKDYALAVVTVASERDTNRVQRAIEAQGLRVFSFAERFREMQRQFLIFDVMVAVLGFIAIFVAALGIVNTMVMSIVERTREIGILKALGAEDGHVRLLFLLESGLLGLIGSLGGLLLGWLVSRAGAFVIRRVMIAQEIPEMDMFHLPLGIALAAVAFGVLVSLLAGVYPAARAARVDPVRALRHD